MTIWNNGAIRWQIVRFALSLTLEQILSKQDKSQNFAIENEAEDEDIEERDLRLSPENVRSIYVFFFNFSYLATYVYAQGNTATGVMTTGKICKADLPENCAEYKKITFNS